jgi:recombinational DNA repair ATPase RecF
MILRSLTVEQYRGFASRTPIEFDPSFTLIVGENGVGKTSCSGRSGYCCPTRSPGS